MKLTGEEIKKIVIADNVKANLVFSELKINSGADAAVEIGKKAVLNVKFIKENKIIGTGKDGIVLKEESALKILKDSEGSLLIEKDENALTPDVPAIVLKDDKSEFTMEGGTLISDITRAEDTQKLNVTGGSLKAEKLKGTVVNEAGDKLYKTVVPTGQNEKAVDKLSITLDGQKYSYGSKGIIPDETNSIYIYLPKAGTARVIADDVVSGGKVAETSGTAANNLKKEEAVLTLTVPSFDKVTYGYENQPAAKNITIKNAGSKAETLKVEIVSGKEYFELKDSGNVEIPVDGSDETYEIQPKKGLAAGSYEVKVRVTYNGGKTVEAAGTFAVEKAKLTPVITIKKKVYDGTTDASGTVTLKGAVGQDKPKLKDGVTFKFNSKNVAKADKVTVENMELDEESAKNYVLTETSAKVDASITKAPHTKGNGAPKKSSIKAIYKPASENDETEEKWQLQMTTYGGQEYLFTGGNVTKLSEKNLASKNWAFGKKETAADRLISLGVEANKTYAVWTRYAGDDNHFAGKKVERMTVTIQRETKTYTAADNAITGLTEGVNYRTGVKLTFAAVGAGMDNENPISGDERYLPKSWKISSDHPWTKAPYTAAFQINKSGSYTLQVSFKKQAYDGEGWSDTGETSTLDLDFTTSATGVIPTTNGSGGNGTGTGGGNGKGSSAAKSGDSSSIMLFAAAFAGAGSVLTGYGFRRKRKK